MATHLLIGICILEFSASSPNTEPFSKEVFSKEKKQGEKSKNIIGSVCMQNFVQN